MWDTDLLGKLRRLWYPCKFDSLHGLTFPCHVVWLNCWVHSLLTFIVVGFMLPIMDTVGRWHLRNKNQNATSRMAVLLSRAGNPTLPQSLSNSVVILSMDLIKNLPSFVPEHECFGLSKTKATALVRLGHWSLGKGICSTKKGETLFIW